MRDAEAAVGSIAFSVETESAEQTESLGETWARVLRGGELLLLEGELGAGKTTLVRGLARGLGVDHGVKSPSFAIRLEYPGRLSLHHVDLYRVTDVRDLEELGLDDILGREGVTVVEWGERLGRAAPNWAVRVVIEDVGPTRRRLSVSGDADTAARLRAARRE